VYVRLISRDEGLIRLCREIQSDFLDSPWHLSTEPAEGDAVADLHIWDFDPGAPLPPGLRPGTGRHLLLVSRKHVAEFHERLRSYNSIILLKPVTRSTLTAFLELAASSHAECRSAVSGIRADRDELLQCLIQANLKLQEFDQDRTNFLARALRDFRAPLTAIGGYCDLLLNDALGPLREEQKQVLRKMNRSYNRLCQMASDMFQLSMGPHTQVRVERRESDIQECIEQALHDVNPLAAAKDISVSTDLDPGTTFLSLEPGSIEQVLVNILDNACKFTPRSGEIVIRGYPFFWDRRLTNSSRVGRERRQQNSQSPNVYRIDILNSGARVPEEHLEDMFVENTSYSRGQDRSGGGLGLAICRMIIARHGGRIWAENRERGPVFSFVLPFCAPQASGSSLQRSNSLA
jgi:signal transduction histidine kinase